ncbi:MAG: hypothetical protein V7K41_05020 [Nostoc sp.]
MKIKFFENKINQKIDEANAQKDAIFSKEESDELERIHNKQVNEIAFSK